MNSFIFNPFTGNFDVISTIVLGTPNGLSLVGQTLSLGLSSTSTTGALSSTDWNTFNTKQPAGNYITSLTGDVVAAGPGAAASTIQANVVSNAKLAQMAAHTYKGNNTGSTANALDVTSTQLTADLNLFTSGLQGLVPASGGGTTNFLRADGTWASAGLTNPMTTLGDTIYGGAAGAATRLAGDTTNARVFLLEQSVAGTATAPVWSLLTSVDIPNNAANTTGTSSNVTGVVALINGGTGTAAASANAAFNALSPLTTKGDVLTFSTVNARLAVGSNGQVLTADSAQTLGIKWATPTTGTVTSVAFSDGSSTPIYTVSGSPVTSTGTLTITLANQTANTVFAGATSGGAAQPTFRALVVADLPTVTIAKGGTGQVTAPAAFSALSPVTTTGDLIYSSSGTTNSRLGIGSTGQVLTVVGGVPAWAPAPGGGGSNTSPRFTLSGEVVPFICIDGVYYVRSTNSLASANISALNSGTSGSTVIQINQYRSGSLQASATASLAASSGNPSGSAASLSGTLSVVAGDLLTVDVNSIAAGTPSDLSVEPIFT